MDVEGFDALYYFENFEAKTSDIYEEKRYWIKVVKSRVMEHLESVEEARYMVEQSTKEIDLEKLGAEINAATEQDHSECLNEGISEHPE